MLTIYTTIKFAYIVNNNITGPGFATPAPPSSSFSNYATALGLIEGIHASFLTNSFVTCNYVSNTNTGFFFGGLNTVKWESNEMNYNSYGYVLNGVIGQQGFSGFEVCNNIWTPGAGFWTGGTNFQTYVLATSSSAALSQLDVDMSNDPTWNFGDFPPLPSYYAGGALGAGTGVGLNITTGSTLSCPFTPPPTTVALMPVFVKAATKQLEYTINIPKKDWIGQYGVWRSLSADTTEEDTSSVLHSFRLMGANCRYNHLTDIEDNIMNGDYASAQTKLGYGTGYMASSDSDVVTGAVLADDTTADNVVINYKQYYGLLLKYMQDTLSGDDSIQVVTLANKCPFVDGAIVYQARTLYSQLYNDYSVFNDLGCEFGPHTTGEGRSRLNDSTTRFTSINKSNQQYTLSPNPTTGNLTLRQSMLDDRPVAIDIWNASGENMYKDHLRFDEGIGRLQLNSLVPGLYMMQLVDGSGNMFALKFVVSK